MTTTNTVTVEQIKSACLAAGVSPVDFWVATEGNVALTAGQVQNLIAGLEKSGPRKTAAELRAAEGGRKGRGRLTAKTAPKIKLGDKVSGIYYGESFTGTLVMFDSSGVNIVLDSKIRVFGEDHDGVYLSYADLRRWPLSLAEAGPAPVVLTHLDGSYLA